MSGISALVHTLNEEGNLERCLRCLMWCDEVVVVDMMSDDRTVEIARRFTDKVYSFPRMGLADPARRFGVEKTTGDWILIVDADELVPRSLMERLMRIAGSSDTDVVLVPYRNYLLGEWIRHTAWWPEYHPRFFRRGTVVPNDRVHGRYVVLSTRILKLEAEEDASIHHFNYLDSFQFVEKMNRYTGLEAEAFEKEDGREFSAARLVVRPLFEFAFRFFYKRGFLDGPRGFFLSGYMAFYRFLSEAKLWERKNNRDPAEKYDRIKEGLCGGYDDRETSVRADREGRDPHSGSRGSG